MKWTPEIAVAVLLAVPAQSPPGAVPAYVREGNRVEQQFREYRDRLTQFAGELRDTVSREAAPSDAQALRQQLQGSPPPPGIYGYQILPRVIPIAQPATPISIFAYSWPATSGYVIGENIRLDSARLGLTRIAGAAAEEKRDLLFGLAAQYRELLRNQRTVEQYIQYNRFWQREIAQDKSRFDRLTQVYQMMKSGNTDTAEAIRRVLGKPQAPNFIRIRRDGATRITLQVRVYSDIEEDAYLAQAKSVIEEEWKAQEDGIQYAIELDIQKTPAGSLYRDGNAPRAGEHLDLDKHVARFPNDGGVLTTGAQFTFGATGRYVALGPGELAPKTLAHEFGHILGFTDGYIRAYADLGEQGFEILELTTFFDDIMTAPREGRAQASHFKLLIEALGR